MMVYGNDNKIINHIDSWLIYVQYPLITVDALLNTQPVGAKPEPSH